MIIKLPSISEAEVRTLYGLLGYECTGIPATIQTCDCHLCEVTRLLVRAMRRGFNPKEFADKYPEIVTFLDMVLRQINHTRESLVWRKASDVWKRNEWTLPLPTVPGAPIEWGLSRPYHTADDTFHKSETLAKRVVASLNKCFFTGKPLGMDSDILTAPLYDHHAVRVSPPPYSTGCVQECVACGESFAIPQGLSSTILGLFDRNKVLTCEMCESQRYRCPDCKKVHEPGVRCDCVARGFVMNWDYKPRFTYFLADGEKNDRRKLFTGIELEVSLPPTGHNLTGRMSARCSRHPALYTVHDGSIQRGHTQGWSGFEIVSHPFSQEFWASDLRAELEQITGELKANDAQAWDAESCGFHIHISRRAFTDAQLYKVLHLLMRNRRWTMRFAQRRPNKWFEKYSSLTKEGNSTAELVHKAQRFQRMSRDERYVGINTTNTKDIEFRFFRGSLNMAVIEMNLELIWALHAWAQTAALRSVTTTMFEKWVQTRASLYPNLAGFLDHPAEYTGD